MQDQKTSKQATDLENLPMRAANANQPPDPKRDPLATASAGVKIATLQTPCASLVPMCAGPRCGTHKQAARGRVVCATARTPSVPTRPVAPSTLAPPCEAPDAPANKARKTRLKHLYIRYAHTASANTRMRKHGLGVSGGERGENATTQINLETQSDCICQASPLGACAALVRSRGAAGCAHSLRELPPQAPTWTQTGQQRPEQANAHAMHALL